MDYSLGNLVAHICWVVAKTAVPGWEDIRRTVTGHTFYYIHSGKGVFTSEKSEIIAEGGTLFYLCPGVSLSMKSSDSNPLRMTMLLFDCASLQIDGNRWQQPVPVERLRLPFLMPLQPDRSGKICTLFKEAERNWVPGDPGHEAQVKSVWYRLIQEIHAAVEPGTCVEGEKELSEALKQIKESLDEGFATELRITELQKQYGFSSAYLRRMFTACYGYSPKEYLERLRNEHATRRLQYTGDSISDVARACGYPDVYQFSKAFKKRNGLSPTEYRRTNEFRYMVRDIVGS
jgi:AraC family transcriptional regulator